MTTVFVVNQTLGCYFKPVMITYFNLKKHCLFGDDPRDCQTAEKAGCNSIFIGKEEELKTLTVKEQPICSSTSLLNMVDDILKYLLSSKHTN